MTQSTGAALALRTLAAVAVAAFAGNAAAQALGPPIPIELTSTLPLHFDFAAGSDGSVTLAVGHAAGAAVSVATRRYDANAEPLSPWAISEIAPVGAARELSLDVASDGAFAVAWKDAELRSYARSFGADGTAYGPPALVTEDESEAQLLRHADGRFTVAWAAEGVYYRRFAADGAALAVPVEVAPPPSVDTEIGEYRGPSLAEEAAGNLLVGWNESRGGLLFNYPPLPPCGGLDSGGCPVYLISTAARVKRFAADDRVQGSTSLIDSAVDVTWRSLQNDVGGLSLAPVPSGGWVSAWLHGNRLPGTQDPVKARRHGAGGAPRTAVANVESAEGGACTRVAANDDGSFVVAWVGGPGYALLMARPYLASGLPASDAVRVSERVAEGGGGMCRGLALVTDASGDFWLAWPERADSGAIQGYLQRFAGP